MLRTFISACMTAFLTLPFFACAAPAAGQTVTLTGRWIVTADFYGSIRYLPLQLQQQDKRITGSWSGTDLEGSLDGTNLHFIAKNGHGGTNEVDATVGKGTMTGTAVQTNPDEPNTSFHFIATFVPPLAVTTPQRHEFTPSVFYREFSPFNKPVLTVASGDTIQTTTVDAGGNDENGVKRVAGGNPETGPFYIEGAIPGDTLIVHLTHLRLNRDWAGSDDAIVESGLNSGLAVKMKGNGKSVRWNLDLAKGVASPTTPGSHMTNFTVPLRPMLGCIAVATSPSSAPPPTGDSGFWGGNMDFNEIGEGATVYLPVLNPGALLYVGDGHALQGDGELNGNALETSMDVEFTVTVVQAKHIPSVRVETADAIIAMGLEGSLDDAFRSATSNMAQWLAEDYKLTSSEIAQFLGTTAQYRVSEVADRNSGIVLKISKERLRSLAAAGQ